MNDLSHYGVAIALLCAAQPVLAVQSSPFAPPEEKLGRYVVDNGPGLDTGCSFRGQGPLIIQLTVPATMNPNELNADGTLKDPQKLIQNKVIGSQAKITFPTYDIDDQAVTDGTYAPEIDKIYFNGEYVKNLHGSNDTWVNDSFNIDISKVRFNQPNEIRIDIDQGNIGNEEYWCMAVDWVAIEYDSAAPYVLFHGINAQADTWDDASASGVLATMDSSGVLYTRFSTAANGSVADNAKDLKAKIAAFLKPLKAKKVNIIAHSKGGLDAQMVAKITDPAEFKVLSLSTLSTPHRGSVVADLQLMQRQAIDEYVNQGQDPNGYAQQFVSLSLAGWANRNFGAGPQPPGLNDLTTQAAVQAIIAGTRGNVPTTLTIGADAGPNCSRQPTDAEIDPLADEAPISYTYDGLRLAYQLICDFSSATQLSVTTEKTLFGLSSKYILTYSTVTKPMAEPNDIVVGIRSANPGWGTPVTNNQDTNHSEVKNGDNVQSLLDRTIKLR